MRNSIANIDTSQFVITKRVSKSSFEINFLINTVLRAALMTKYDLNVSSVIAVALCSVLKHISQTTFNHLGKLFLQPEFRGWDQIGWFPFARLLSIPPL